MSLIHCDFYSNALSLCTSMIVILPDPKRDTDGKLISKKAKKYPTLYLLHGMSDDHTIWQRRTSIERYVADMDLAVVMPAVHRSFYADMASGFRYWTYVTEEVPAMARAMFPLSERREDNFAAGLSMGGFGAFKIGLTYPDRYGAVASLSGALDMTGMLKHSEPAWRKGFKPIFGDLRKFEGGPNDLMALAKKLAGSEWKNLPLFQWCGTEDFLYEGNLHFRDCAQSLGLNLTYEEAPGTHEWRYWDQMIQRVLEWLPLKKRKSQ